MASKFGFDEMLKALERAKVDMPKKIATEGQFYFAANFRKQQSPNGVKWKPRKKEVTPHRPLLVRTGRLRGAMANTVKSYNWKKIVWGVDISYAGYLNYGTDKMVARPFLADGKEIRGKIKGIIKTEFDKIMKVK